VGIGIALGILMTLSWGGYYSLAREASPQALAKLTQATQGNCQTFTQTGHTVCGRFLIYWNEHGGLAQQGYQLS